MPKLKQRKNNANKNHTKNQPHDYAQNYFPSDDDEDLVLTVLINQIFSNHTHEMNK